MSDDERGTRAPVRRRGRGALQSRGTPLTRTPALTGRDTRETRAEFLASAICSVAPRETKTALMRSRASSQPVYISRDASRPCSNHFAV